MLITFLVACGPEPTPPGPEPVEPTTPAPTPEPFEGETAVTDGGLYTLIWAPDRDPWPDNELVELAMAIERDAGVPEVGALLDVNPWMPTMGHGIAGAVEIEEPEPGIYLASWEFSMPGPWQVEITIDGSNGSDRLVLATQVQ